MNVNLWFAKNSKDDIILITEINEQNRNEKYICPVCGSEVVPKAIGEDCVVSRHFAHSDKSKCSSESQIHFFFKHKLIEIGDKFKVLADKEYEFVCKDIQVEQEHKTEFGVYIPDMTVYTECGETIYFEMNYKSKKKIDDYVDKWICLKNIVVEVNIKDLLDYKRNYNGLYYNGKIYNKKVSKDLKIRTEIFQKYTKEDIYNVNWIFNECIKLKLCKTTVEDMYEYIDLLNSNEQDIVFDVLKKIKCNEINRGKYYAHIMNNRNKEISKLYFNDILSQCKYAKIEQINSEKLQLSYEDVNFKIKSKDLKNYNEILSFDKKFGIYKETCKFLDLFELKNCIQSNIKDISIGKIFKVCNKKFVGLGVYVYIGIYCVHKIYINIENKVYDKYELYDMFISEINKIYGDRLIKSYNTFEYLIDMINKKYKKIGIDIYSALESYDRICVRLFNNKTNKSKLFYVNNIGISYNVDDFKKEVFNVKFSNKNPYKVLVNCINKIIEV